MPLANPRPVLHLMHRSGFFCCIYYLHLPIRYLLLRLPESPGESAWEVTCSVLNSLTDPGVRFGNSGVSGIVNLKHYVEHSKGRRVTGCLQLKLE